MKSPALVIRDRLACGNVCQVAILNLLGCPDVRQARRAGLSGIFPAACSRVTVIFSKVWFALISFFIPPRSSGNLPRDAVRQFDVVSKSRFPRPGRGELGHRGRAGTMAVAMTWAAGVPDALQFGHLSGGRRGVLRSFVPVCSADMGKSLPQRRKRRGGKNTPKHENWENEG